MKPKFSVIIPTYNRAATLGRAIESVLFQTYSAWEILVVDDGSTDDTPELIKSFSTVRYYNQENKGVSSARNKGAELATGDWLIFLDSDDELLSNALLEFSKSINQHSDSAVVLGGYFLNKNGSEQCVIPVHGKYIGHLSGSFVIKKSLFRNVGGYDPILRFAENTELFFRINKLSILKAVMPFPVLKYNQTSTGGNNNLFASSEAIEYILQKHPDLAPRVRRLYHQILGVNNIRFRDFSKARFHLWKAYLLNPLMINTLVRLILSCFPPISKAVYTSFLNPK